MLRVTYIRKPWASSTYFHTTNLIDINWGLVNHQSATITKVAVDTASSSASTPSWTRTNVADGHQLSAVILSRSLLNRSENVILANAPAFGSDPIGIS